MKTILAPVRGLLIGAAYSPTAKRACRTNMDFAGAPKARRRPDRPTERLLEKDGPVEVIREHGETMGCYSSSTTARHPARGPAGDPMNAPRRTGIRRASKGRCEVRRRL